MIPSNIFQTFYGDFIPEESKKKQNLLKELNPNFNYFFYDSIECLNFIKEYYEKYYNIYLSYPHYQQKENFFKILIIYHYGGFFFDIDFLPQKNIEELQKYSCVLPQEKEISNDCFYKKYGKYAKNSNELKQIGLYAFGAEKGHPLLLHIIDEMVYRFNDYKISEQHLLNSNILVIERTTGTDIISIIYHSFADLYDDIKILKGNDMESMDKNKHCLNTWYKFGIYGEFFYSDSLQKIRDYYNSDTVRIDIKDNEDAIMEEKPCIIS